MNGGIKTVVKNEVGSSRLWKGMVVFHCLYGSQITSYKEGYLNKLKKTQSIIVRWGLGAQCFTTVEALKRGGGLDHLQVTSVIK